MLFEEIAHPQVSWLQHNPVPFLFLLGQGEEEAQHRRQVLLDVGGDDPPHPGTCLDRLDLGVEGGEHDHGLGTDLVQRIL